MSAARARRERAGRVGRRAEWLAIWRLRFAGYRILAQNLRTPVGEIDLIARRGKTLAFVEVKARPTLAAAAEALGLRQQARIRRAAEFFLAGRPALARLNLRFDVILVTPRGLPRHFPDAWRDSTRVIT